jgi:ribosomal protein S18 acetylase RimI-like enzyme
MDLIEIKPYAVAHRDDVVQIAIRAWRPVFAMTAYEVPSFVYEAFYPRGWEERQKTDVATFLDSEGENCWLAHRGDSVIGFIGLRMHRRDQMGEIYMLAVDPDHQRKGIGRELMKLPSGSYETKA